MQLAILYRPEQGKVIQGSGGLRKLRWRTKGSGKRGGLRVIYYWIHDEDTIFMLYAYRKNEKADLTKDQIRVLGKLVEEEFK